MPAQRLPWSTENLMKVMTELMQKGYNDPEYKKQLGDPAFAKAEVANLVETPPDWDSRVIWFRDEDQPVKYVTTAHFKGDGSYQIECTWH